jgi:hypothetical protein
MRPAFALAFFLPLAAAAQGSFDIECAALGDEGRAELAARMHAELGLRQTNTYASVACESDTVYLALVDGQDTLRSELRITDLDDTRPLKDRILDRLATLVAARPKARPTRPPPASGPAPQAEARREPEHDPWESWLMLGLKGEAWGGAAAGSLGPRLGFGWARRSFAFGAVATLAWGVRAPSDLQARALTPMLVVDGFVHEALSFGGGVGASWVVVARENQTEDTLVGAAMLRVRGHWLSLSFGPELSVSSAPVNAHLDGEEVFQIPQLTIGVAIELGVGL